MSSYNNYKIKKILKSKTFWTIVISLTIIISILITMPIVSLNQIQNQKDSLENEFRSDLNNLEALGISEDTSISTKDFILQNSISTKSQNESFSDIKEERKILFLGEGTFLSSHPYISIRDLLLDVSELNFSIDRVEITTEQPGGASYFNPFLSGLKSSQPTSENGDEYFNAFDGEGRIPPKNTNLDFDSEDATIMKELTIPTTDITLSILTKLPENYSVKIDGEDTGQTWWKSTNLNHDSTIEITNTDDSQVNSYTVPEEVKIKEINGYNTLPRLSLFTQRTTGEGDEQKTSEVLLSLYPLDSDSNFIPVQGLNAKMMFSMFKFSNFNKDEEDNNTYSNSYYVIKNYLDSLNSKYENNSEINGIRNEFLYEIYSKDTWQSNWDQLMNLEDSSALIYVDYLSTTYEEQLTNPQSLNSSEISFDDFKVIVNEELLLWDDIFTSTINLIIDDALSAVQIFDIPYPY